MKIGTPVQRHTIRPRWQSNDYEPLRQKLETLPENLALPVENDTAAEAMKVQRWVYAILNRAGAQKYEVVRRKNTVFISKANGVK